MRKRLGAHKFAHILNSTCAAGPGSGFSVEEEKEEEKQMGAKGLARTIL